MRRRDVYKRQDICCAFAGEGDYMRMAMPIKVFEYLGHYIPIIATKDTAAGKFIEKENLGWSIEYNQEALKQCLHNIFLLYTSNLPVNYDLIREKKLGIAKRFANGKEYAEEITKFRQFYLSVSDNHTLVRILLNVGNTCLLYTSRCV